MPHPPARRTQPATAYVYRRRLDSRELIPAVGVGIGVGFAAFYVARVLLQRTALGGLQRAALGGRERAALGAPAARRGQRSHDLTGG